VLQEDTFFESKKPGDGDERTEGGEIPLIGIGRCPEGAGEGMLDLSILFLGWL